MPIHLRAARGLAIGLLAPAVALSLVLGCRTTPKTQSGPAAVKTIGAPLTDKDYESFSAELTKAVASGKNGPLLQLIDHQAIIDSCAEAAGMSAEMKSGFERGFNRSALENGGMLREVVGVVASGGSFTLLRVASDGGTKRARFRLVFPDAGDINYLDFVIARRPDGKLKAIDFYSFMSGEYISETLRRSMVSMAATENRGILARLTRGDRDFVENAEKVKSAGIAIREGRNSEAHNILKSLPESLQNDKLILLLRLRAAMAISDAEYSKAMEAYRRVFPRDPSTAFVSIDHFLMKKDFAKTLDLVEQLDRAVSGDPYLNVLRASVLVLASRNREAVDLASRAVRDFPHAADAHFVLISAALQAKRHDLVASELTVLKRDLRMPLEDLTKVPEYADFARSPEYREWKRSQ